MMQAESILVFDTETTGVNVAEDRILTCYMAEYTSDMNKVSEQSWVINPGVHIPEEASSVHGMTDEWIHEHGRRDRENAVYEIFERLSIAVNAGVPIAAFNLRFDLTLLHHEMLRYGNGSGVMPIVEDGVFYDALVHDKGRDKFRKGKRTLQAICEHNGIEFNDSEAHAAEYDVLKTAELSFKLLKKEKRLKVEELMPLLVKWESEQSESLESYFAKCGKTNNDGSRILIDRGWPLIKR
jgi:DNA polymerase-3 subunit epsilon